MEKTSDTQPYKDVLELEKLRHELEILRRPFWHDPKLIGAVIAFLISFGFNLVQVVSAQKESRRKDAELSLRIQESVNQRQKVEAEVERLRQQIAAASKVAASCSNAEAELAAIAKDIQYTNEALARERGELANSQNRLRDAEKKGFSQSADAIRPEIATFERWVLQLTESREAAVKRRSELEQRCR